MRPPEGHLSRLLGHGHDFTVAMVDLEDDFTKAAKKFDAQLKQTLEKKNLDQIKKGPSHVTFRLDPEMEISFLEKELRSKFDQEVDLRYGVVRLHTCGDLGPLLIKLFAQSPNCVSLQSMGCCYMKLEHCLASCSGHS